MKTQFFRFHFFRGDKMRDQVLNPKRLMLLFLTVLLTYGVESLSYGAVCEAGDILAPGESCTYPGTDVEFSVLNNGSGQFLFFTSGNNITIRNTVINGVSYTLVANKLASGSWKIEEVADSEAPGTTNTAPTFTDGASTTRSVAENTVANVNIGTAITATDADNDTLTYTLSGTDAASFGINSSTGQLQTKAALDYETKTTYTVTITVSDGSLTDTITVTINVTDVVENRAPTFTSGASTTRSIAENTAANTNIGTPVAATDADNDTLTYTLGGTDAASFGINSSTGQLQTKAALDYETKSTYTVTVTVSDGTLTDTITVTISVTDVAEIPTTGVTPPEVCQAGAVLAPGESCTYPGTNTKFSVLSSGRGKLGFFISSNNINIKNTVINGQPYTFVANKLASGSWKIEEIADSTAPGTTNTAPTFTDGASTTRSISENTATGVNIGAAIVATDADNDTLTYTLGGTDAASFGINSSTGQLQTKAALDYETKTTYTVTVTVSDSSLTDTITVTINVTDVVENAAPVFTAGASTTRSIAENTAAGANIGTPVAATDADNDTLTYTLGGTDAAAFSIISGTGQLQTKVALDYETKRSYTVTVTVSDGSLTDSITVTINITDVVENRAPTFTEGASTTRTMELPPKPENPGDMDIGTPLFATDADGDTLRYTLGGTDASLFHTYAFVTYLHYTTPGVQLTTRGGSLYDGTKSSYTVIVTVSDGSLTDTITVTINVTDAAEPLTATTAIDIPDPNLRAKIEAALGKTSGDPISTAEMETLTTLSAQDAGITNLTGLETATNLTHLYLWGNTIMDISTVAGLTKLTHLYLHENTISDISAVAGLTNLIYLRIGDNEISDISAVAHLTKLEWLDAPNNSVTDINAVTTLANLTSLTLNGNNISDISPAGGLTNLLELVISDNDISNLSPLVANTGLGTDDEIDVRGNPLNYPSIYTHIPALQARGAFVDFDNRTPAAPVKISGDSQQGASSTALVDPFVVEVQDGAGIVFAGVPVTFAVTAGGGTLNAASTTTDDNGRAETTLILGSSAGANTVRVSVQGVSQVATFTATATTTNTAPTFTEGTSTTRTIAENTAVGQNIGTEITATDVDNDTLTYTLNGTDAASFGINGSTGQLQTKAALDYETKNTYTVTVTVSDGSLTDTITVTINVTDVTETPADTGVCQVGDVLAPGESCTYPGTNTKFSVLSSGRGKLGFFISSNNINIKNTVINGQPYTFVANKLASGSWKIEEIADSASTPGTTNTAPTFTDGASTTRSTAENTAAGIHIGTPVAATDVDNDTLTYTLGGTDAASFGIDATTGQLKTKAALDYETKRSYTVTVIVSDGNLTDSIAVTINVTDVADPPVSGFTPVCDRTPQVRDGIVAAVPSVNDCKDVTEAHLAAITVLNLNSTNITVLKSGDFGGLSALYELRLERNQLRTLPSGIFSGLSSLWALFLGNNRLTHLPADVFSGLSALQHIYLNQNQLGSLPADVFSGLTSLVQINLHTNLLTNLPADVFSGLPSLLQIYLRNNRLTNLSPRLFSGLSSLQSLYLDKNRLRTVPAGVFSGLSSLKQLLLNDNQMSTLSREMFRGLTASTWLWLQGNTVDPLPLTVSLEKVGVNQFKATVPAGAPFTITIPISVVNGAISGGGSTLTIPQGSVESGRITVTRTAGTTAAVTVDIGALPRLPANHRGYQLAKPTDPPLEIISGPGNSAPIFTDGTSTTRSIAENTATGIHIGNPVVATDADNDTLTYTLGGTDAASFGIDATTGQLKTKAALDYETKRSYTVTVTVSDGTLTDSITVTINVTDIDESLTDTGICKVGDILAPGESCTYPGTDATFSVLNNGHARWNIPNLPSWLAWANKVSIGGSLSFTATINDDDYHFVAEEVPNDSWEIKEIGDDRTEQPETPEQPEQPGDTGTAPTLSASTTTPLTEATLNESVVTLTLNGGTYESSSSRIRNAVTVSTSISGVTVRSFDIDRKSDTEVAVELTFDGTDFDTNSTITFTVGAGAIANYDGTALAEQVSVSATTESVVASTASPLTEDTLDGGVVTLTLSGRNYERSSVRIRNAVTVSGISGVTVGTFDIDRVNDTQVTVELTFNGNISTDSTLTFTVGPGAMANYDGTALTAQVSVTASTDAQTPQTPQQPQTPQTPQQPGGGGGTPTLRASTTSPLTETTLNESIVTLTLSGGTYVDSSFSVARAITVSGIDGATLNTWDVDDISDTVVEVELTFDGDFDTNATLTFTVGPGAIADYDGPALTVQVPVTGGPESIVASTDAPLTEATLHESVVTITLSGRVYEDSSFSVARAITVSGIDGVTFNTWDVDDVSDTEVEVELTFDGDFNTNATLTFTVGAGAIKDYNGPALTAQVSVTGGPESIVASTDAPLTEATLDESVVTLTLSGRTYARSSWDIRDAVTVSGIAGVTIPWHEPERKSDTQITVELEFDGTNFDTDSTLTFTVGADAIAGYNGPALTAQVSVTATQGVLQAPSGISLIHVPLRVTAINGVAQTIESVGDLYDALGGAEAVNLLTIYDPETQSWHSYLGEHSRGTAADTVLAEHQGIIADLKTPVTLQLDGDALGSNGSSSITLHPGTNLVGMSLKDPRITRVSDLFALEEIRDNASTITVLNNGTFQTVGQAGDAGDIRIMGGQSFILNAREAATVAISGQGWNSVSGAAAAAPVGLMGIEVGNTTPILALMGSIVSADRMRSGSGFRVIVKNLSTRKSVVTTTRDAGGHYQLTVVDTKTARAAQIGDILEISVRSPDPRIGVQPLRYTVTPEDVKRSRIELDNLVVYEIPTETEPLANYPNPFNPETWIPYRLAEDAFVTLTIYDTAGGVVRSIDVGYKPAAVYESKAKAIYWDGRNELGKQVTSGVYFYHLSAENYSATRKMLILK